MRRDGAACEISGKQQRDDFDCVWCGAFGCPIFPGAIFAGRFGCSAGDVWRGSVQKLLLGGLSMKVVSFRSPKLLSGILRLIFGIKKSDGV
ncbi:MAG: stage V sporulation protein SpoVM [Clostridiales bacterium]|nr:stage V sporulation protein SpoVM [Clostridiales bacterium]